MNNVTNFYFLFVINIIKYTLFYYLFMGLLPLLFKKFNWNLLKKVGTTDVGYEGNPTNELPVVKNYSNLDNSKEIEDYFLENENKQRSDSVTHKKASGKSEKNLGIFKRSMIITNVEKKNQNENLEFLISKPEDISDINEK